MITDNRDDNNDVSQESEHFRRFRLIDLEILNQTVITQVVRAFCKKVVQRNEVERKGVGGKFAFYVARNVTDKIIFSLSL